LQDYSCSNDNGAAKSYEIDRSKKA